MIWHQVELVLLNPILYGVRDHDILYGGCENHTPTKSIILAKNKVFYIYLAQNLISRNFYFHHFLIKSLFGPISDDFYFEPRQGNHYWAMAKSGPSLNKLPEGVEMEKDDENKSCWKLNLDAFWCKIHHFWPKTHDLVGGVIFTHTPVKIGLRVSECVRERERKREISLNAN